MKFGRTINAVMKHVVEMGHAIAWKGASYLEKEKRLNPRIVFDGFNIKNISIAE